MVKFFIENPKLTIIFSLFMMMIGLIGLKEIQAEANPAVDFATAIITTNYPGATASDIETKITKPIEDEIRTVTDLKDVRSISQPGLSTIIVRVDMDKKGVVVSDVMSDLQKAVDRVPDLPADLVDLPRFLEIKSDEYPVMNLSVTGSNENRFRDIVADQLKDELEDIRSIKSITLEGYNERRFNIDLKIEKLRALNIGVDEVLAKIKARNITVPSGNLKSTQDQLLTRIEAKVNDVEELKNLVVRSSFSGRIIKLKDVADITDGQEEPELLVSYNGQDSTLLTINKKSNTDTLKLIEDIGAKITQFEKTYGDKISFNISFNEANEVKQRLSILSGNALAGLAIMLPIMFIFLPWRIAIAAAISLPISVLATLGLMYFFGINLNTVTILALVIVLGMLVDNSVVVSEDFTRNVKDGMRPYSAVELSVKRFGFPIVATTLTTIAAFLPMLVTKGIMGEFIKWIPIIVTMALIISLIEFFFLLPMRLTFTTKNIRAQKETDFKHDWFHKFEVKFERLIYLAVKKRYLALLAFFGVLIMSFFMLFIANKFILFPNEQTEIYIARFELDKNSRLENSAQVMKEISSQIKAQMKDKVVHIVGRAGVNDLNASQPKYMEGSNIGYLTIHVSDKVKYHENYEDVLKQFRAIKFSQNIKIDFEGQVNGPPIGSAIEASFRSNNIEDIDRLISLIKSDLDQEKGIYDLKTDDRIGEDEIIIKIDYDKLDRMGLSVDAVGEVIKTAVAGTIASKVVLNNKEVELFVNFEEKYRTSLEDLKHIQVMDKRGNLVKIGNFTSFEKISGSPFIKRYDYKRAKTLLGNVDDSIITSTQANQKLRQSYKKYAQQFPNVSLSFGGIEESTNESLSSLGNAFLLSMIGIFGLLVFSFKSYLRPFIILTTVPLGLFGFAFGFLLHGKPISFVALIGVVGLGGVIVNAGVILVSYILDLQQEEKFINDAKSDPDALNKMLAYASAMRIRSVLISTFTTIASLIPTAYGIGGTDAILSPMTLAMGWGLSVGTVLTLIWIPCFYAILEDLQKFVSKVFRSKNTLAGRNL